MGLLSTGSTVELQVYLTDLGRQALLQQGFAPVSFSISDDDVDYNANGSLTQIAVDLTGDYTDNVFSISKNITIKNQIIRS